MLIEDQPKPIEPPLPTGVLGFQWQITGKFSFEMRKGNKGNILSTWEYFGSDPRTQFRSFMDDLDELDNGILMKKPNLIVGIGRSKPDLMSMVGIQTIDVVRPRLLLSHNTLHFLYYFIIEMLIRVRNHDPSILSLRNTLVGDISVVDDAPLGIEKTRILRHHPTTVFLYKFECPIRGPSIKEEMFSTKKTRCETGFKHIRTIPRKCQSRTGTCSTFHRIILLHLCDQPLNELRKAVMLHHFLP